MTDNNSDCSETRTTSDPSIINIITDHYPDYEPVVRYAYPRDDGGPKQEPRLRSVHGEVPEGANWVSAIYLITENQLNRLEANADTPYGNPSPDNIAKTIQDECEDAGRVLYSVHAESDAHEDDDENEDVVLLPNMVKWLQEFVQTVVDIDSDDCTFYYSGNRSIHVHTPLFVTGENLRWLKKQTTEFCERTDADLDASVYKKKQQFRLPGAVHQSNGRVFQKVQIDTDWNRPEIISAAADDVTHPETYAEVLETIFSPLETTDLSELLLSSSATERSSGISSVLSSWPSRYLRPDNEQKRAYNAPEFYPYPTGDEHDGRSVASIRVVDEPFQRRAAGQNRTFVPCFFYGAHSCNGQTYTKDRHYAPLQLSKSDAKNWDYEAGENVVVIGGGSYKSITYKVAEKTAERVGDLLDPDDGDRDDALDYLRDEGYDVGSAGSSQPSPTASNHEQPEQNRDDSPEPETRAAKLQRRAEHGSIEMSLSHDDRRDVANRLLTIGGWDHAWKWFKEQYGGDFDPQRTWQGFRSIIETHRDHDEDFADITVPPCP
jgi:flavodoxin